VNNNYFIPEIGEEVLVGFQGDNAQNPYVLGTHYNGIESEKEYNYYIGFSSREESYSYHLTFNAKDGSWFSLDKSDSFIPWGEKEIRTKNIVEKKHKSPVQLDISWYTYEKTIKTDNGIVVK